ncbi:hypothetical protein GCM10011529_15510 [Polymorphobacter glacialis]|uniref:ABC-2 type transport system permease protein n=1 Tax=Sandarakinorhabdus glacialis TaxID=1614636 RepID=A0A917E8M3_9SPHN|nr:hypothetical protein [Polymorphobacter glacialis]GGE10042.1 hypothetical protein GCM10011529_15510 [Polymorphobacter glacialis]
MRFRPAGLAWLVHQPAGLLWLVCHELRLALRDGSRAGRIGRTVVLVLLMLLPALVGIGLAIAARGVADVPVRVFGMVSAGYAVLLLLMLSGACVYVLRSFHDRGDLDLLLSAPIPAARVLAAKSVAVHASVAMPLFIVTAPFFVTSALLGHGGWLGGMVMLAVTAVIATSLAFVIASALFRAIGARRARTIIQIGGGLFAATVAISGQIPNFAPRQFGQVMRYLAASPPAPLDWPARAVFGEMLPLAAMVLIAAGFALASARMAARSMADAAPVAARSRGANRATLRFRSGAARILLEKEFRLLWRDPELLSSVALQLAYMIPAFGLIFAGGGVSPARLAAACVLFCGLLASSLGWLTICGEDAPELIAAAPVPAALVARTKLLAACLPPLVIVLVPVGFLMGYHPLAGAAALVISPLAALSAAAQQGWLGRPQRRKSFRFRQKSSLLLAVAEYLMAGGWAATATLMVMGSWWALAAAGVAVAVLVGSWVGKRVVGG